MDAQTIGGHNLIHMPFLRMAICEFLSKFPLSSSFKSLCLGSRLMSVLLYKGCAPMMGFLWCLGIYSKHHCSSWNCTQCNVPCQCINSGNSRFICKWISRLWGRSSFSNWCPSHTYPHSLEHNTSWSLGLHFIWSCKLLNYSQYTDCTSKRHQENSRYHFLLQTGTEPDDLDDYEIGGEWPPNRCRSKRGDLRSGGAEGQLGSLMTLQRHFRW